MWMRLQVILTWPVWIKKISDANGYGFIVRSRYANREQDKWINASQNTDIIQFKSQRGEVSLLKLLLKESQIRQTSTHPTPR